MSNTILRAVSILLPSGRRIAADCVYSPEWPGNHENPPEPAEVEEIESVLDVSTNLPLSDAEIQSLLDDDASYEAILAAADELYRMEPDPDEDADDLDDSMDGDHESALASAGWGTDEDYGYQGDDY